MTHPLIETKVLPFEQASSATLLEVLRAFAKFGKYAVIAGADLVMDIVPEETEK